MQPHAEASALAVESFEELYEHAPCGQLTTTPDGVITRVNQTFLDWTSWSRDEVLGLALRDLLTPGSRLFFETRYVPTLRLSGEVREVALAVRRPDDGSLPVLLNAIAVLPDESGPTAVRIAIFDATERQDYERRLLTTQRSAEASETRVRVLQDASVAFAAAMTDDELAIELAASCRDALSATSVAVLFADDSGALRLAAGSHPYADLLAGLDDSPERESMVSGEPVSVSVAELEEAERMPAEVAESLRSARVQSVNVAPLLDEDRRVGVIVCFFARAREADSRAAELKLALGRQAASALRRIRLEHELARMALHDQLTGLANRNLLKDRLAHALDVARRDEVPLALVFVDIDGFKAINDELGHRVGDSVLQQVASRLLDSVRQVDTVGRFGGDEFLIICEGADAEAAAAIGERIRAAIPAPLQGVPHCVTLTASVGISVVVPGASSSVPSGDRLVHAADAAMYTSKNGGKDRVTVVTVGAD